MPAKKALSGKKGARVTRFELQATGFGFERVVQARSISSGAVMTCEGKGREGRCGCGCEREGVGGYERGRQWGR